MYDANRIRALAADARTRKAGRYALIIFVVVGLLGFVVLPPFVKSMLLERLGETLQRPVSVRSVSINPYRLSLTVEGVAVKERGSDALFAGFDRLYVNLEASSIFRGGLVVGEVRLEKPQVNVLRLANGSYNFSDLVEKFGAAPANPEGPPPRFSLNNIQIVDGHFEFDDRQLDEKHVASEVTLTLPFVSNLPRAVNAFVEPAFSARIDGAPLTIRGRSKPFADSLESEVDFDLDALKLTDYVDYLPREVPLRVKSGTLDTRLKVRFLQEKGKPAQLVVSGDFELQDLKLADGRGEPLLAVKRLAAGLAGVDPVQARYDVSRVELEQPDISVRVSRTGQINWMTLAPPPAKAAGPAPAAPNDRPPQWSLGDLRISGGILRWSDESREKPLNASIESIDAQLHDLSSGGQNPARFDLAWSISASPWLKLKSAAIKGGELDPARHRVSIGEMRVSGGEGLIRRLADGNLDWIKPPLLRVAGAAAQDNAAPWTVSLASYRLEDVALRFEDLAVSPPATQTIEGLSIEAQNLSTDPGQSARLAVRLKANGKGEVRVDGDLRPLPLAADLQVDVKSLPLLPLQAYFAEHLNVAVTRGQVAAAGRLRIAQEEGKVSTLVPGFSGGYAGSLTVGDFQAVDKLNSADFLRWKSFHFARIDAQVGPDALSIGDIALADFFARVIVSPEGKLNLTQIVRRPDAPAVSVVPEGQAAAAGASAGEANRPSLPIKIGKVTLQGGNVRFTDNFVKPNYTANLRQVGGSVTGLSSEAGSLATLELRGSYDDVAPLNVNARLNPLAAKPSLDLQADVRGIELTSLSAYAGKYAGYAIEKGKLSLFVKYAIENDQLTAENRVFIDQLTFGDKVDSPDATKLPVLLAVSLLKNRNGEIDINLPISGSLNDPQFSVGGVIVQVIVNLFVKAVTSPFALLGSMFGSGEELSNVEFALGRARLDGEAEKRLEALAKALVDRPSLRLEIEGRYDAELDREGLKSARIDRKVRALKREALTRQGVETGDLDSIVITPQEYPELLERVYRAESFPKPRNMIGLVKSLPVEEMQKLLLAYAVVDDDDLRSLGERRAKAVRDWLLAHAVPAERVFLLPARPAGNEGKAKGSRADFTLK